MFSTPHFVAAPIELLRENLILTRRCAEGSVISIYRRGNRVLVYHTDDLPEIPWLEKDKTDLNPVGLPPESKL